jgi:hypothetical protein
VLISFIYMVATLLFLPGGLMQIGIGFTLMRAYDSKSSMIIKYLLTHFFSGVGHRRACCTHWLSSMCNHITVDWEIAAQKLASN